MKIYGITKDLKQTAVSLHRNREDIEIITALDVKSHLDKFLIT
jgi:hypothetical protein